MSRDCTKSTRPDLTHTVVPSPSQLKQPSKEFQYEAPLSPTEEITKVPLRGFWLGCHQDYSSKEPPSCVSALMVFRMTFPFLLSCKSVSFLRTGFYDQPASDVNGRLSCPGLTLTGHLRLCKNRMCDRAFCTGLYEVVNFTSAHMSQTVWLKSRFEHVMNVVY